MAKLLIIHGTTRPSRLGYPLTEALARLASEHTGLEVEIADLQALNLPFLEDSLHPRMGKYEKEHTKAWAHTVDAADAIVWVSAEYNYGYPAPLKNAIDHLFAEWSGKPLGIVAYSGGKSGGAHAAAGLETVAKALGMNVVAKPLTYPIYPSIVQEDATIAPSSEWVSSATALVKALEEDVSPREDA